MNNYHIKFPHHFILSFVRLAPLFLLFTPAVSHSMENVLAIFSSQDKIYHNFYSTLEDNFEQNISLKQINHLEINPEILNRYEIIISIGLKAAKTLSKYKPESTVIHTLIPDNESLSASISCNNENCYKIYINQPISRYVDLFKILFPEKHNLVFISAQRNSKKSRQLKTAAHEKNITYKEIYIEKNNNIARTLINKLNKNDVLLALSNPTIYNRNNAKNIILSTYHKDVPIIAYSKSFTKAGALTSLYSSINNIAETTAKLANTIIENGPQTHKEHYSDGFSIDINSAVARSLNINIESENKLKSEIK